MLLCGKRLGICSERRRQNAFRSSLQTSDRWLQSARLLRLRAITIYKGHDMKIAIGSDHAGFKYKEAIKLYLTNLGHEVTDFGTDSEAPVDYPIYIRPVAEAVARGAFERGIVLGGSGNGEAIAANRIKGVRCALCWNTETARLARLHNDANALSLGQRMLTEQTALEIVRIWLETPFEGGRHVRRIQLLDQE
jgi:ribose 5-phosphate isomerase B